MTARISLSAHGLCALLCVSRASPFAPGSAEPTACECTLPLACVRTCLGRSRVSRASDPRACRPWTCEWMIDIDRGRKVIRSRTVRGNQSSTRRHLHSVISPPRGGRTYVIAPREDMAFGTGETFHPRRIATCPKRRAPNRPKIQTLFHFGDALAFQVRSPVVARPLKGRTTRIGALGSSHKLLPPSRRAGVDHKPSATATPLHTAMPGHHNGHSDDVSSPQPYARTLPIHTSPSVTCLALPWTRTSPRRPLPHRSSAPRRHTATIGG